VARFENCERLKGVAVYDRQGNIMAATPGLAPKIAHPLPQVVSAIEEKNPAGMFIRIDENNMYLYVLPVQQDDDKVIGALTLFHDTSYIDVRLKEIWRYNLIRLLTLSFVIVVITLLIVRWSITGPIAMIAEWTRELRKGKISKPIDFTKGDILVPLVSEVTHLSKSLAMARARADEEGGVVKCIVPAGGVVTPLDPVMRICDGIWIAHGSGDADRESVDGHDKLRVPPEEPAYTLKRIWLTKEEEDGYYYGFANEGLWPLCHITHTRPVFRLED
jgi:hypothetical protein